VQALSGGVQDQLAQLGRELAEIKLLLQQTATEAERHESRRKQAAERVAALERDPASAGPALPEARVQVVVLTRRTALMEGQLQVLEGKQRVLRRFHDFLTELLPRLPAEAAADEPVPDVPDSRSVLAAQESMRREIARQMHDGPAQSIANIALQAQIVQRLLQRRPEEAEAELGRLTEMVQHALDATKTFIFDVRPMVLDDLGLVATLRRATLEQARRSGVPIRFESVGADRRLSEDVETGLFRILQDAMHAFVATRPLQLVLRLDWTEEQLSGSLQSLTPYDEVQDAAGAASPDADRPPDLPPALANVMREKEEYEAARAAEKERASALPDAVWGDLKARADALGIKVVLAGTGRLLSMTFHEG